MITTLSQKRSCRICKTLCISIHIGIAVLWSLAECLPGFLQLSITRNFLLLFVCFGRQLPPFFYCHAFSTLFLHSSFYPSLGCFLLSPSRSNFIINASSSGTMDSKQAWASSVDCLVICDMSLHGIACVLILWILGW